jgi:hypothetical protein
MKGILRKSGDHKQHDPAFMNYSLYYPQFSGYTPKLLPRWATFFGGCPYQPARGWPFQVLSKKVCLREGSRP